jgi:hypothetical protein
MNALGGDSFDTWLDEQLQHHASASEGPSPMPVQAQYHAAHVKAAGHMSFLAKAAALLSTKAAIGVAASVLVVSAAGTEAVITGSFNPGDWGTQVVQQVNKCKVALAPGAHGIGQCVSSFASQHGKQVSSEHRATPTPGQSHVERTPGPPAVKVHPTPPSHPTPPAHPTPPNTNIKK